MTIALVAATLIALAVGIAIGALVKDNRIERLRTRAEDAEDRAADLADDVTELKASVRNWTAAAHLHQHNANAATAEANRLRDRVNHHEAYCLPPAPWPGEAARADLGALDPAPDVIEWGEHVAAVTADAEASVVALPKKRAVKRGAGGRFTG